MKTLKPLLIIVALIQLFTACKKNDQAETSIRSISKIVVDTSFPTIRVSDGILNFKSKEELDMFCKATQNWSTKKKEMWEDQVGFRSWKTIVNKIYEQIDTITSETEFYNLIKRNSEYIQITESNGENFIKSKIDNLEYQHLVNKDGIYIIGENACKIIQDYIIITNVINVNLLKTLKIDKIFDLPKDQYFVYNFKSPKGLKTLYGDTNTAYLDESGCSSDRCIVVSMGSLLNPYPNPNDPYSTCFESKVYITIETWKKSFLCYWTQYATIITRNDVSYHYNLAGYINGDTWPNYTSVSEENGLSESVRVKDWGTQSPGNVPCDFDVMIVHATHRGMAGIWCNIDH